MRFELCHEGGRTPEIQAESKNVSRLKKLSVPPDPRMTREKPPGDVYVNFKEHQIRISLPTVRVRAQQFANTVVELNNRPLELPRDISLPVMQMFINACEDKPIAPTHETCYDLYYLADKYAPNAVLGQLFNCVRSNPVELAVPALKFAADKDERGTADFEEFLRQQDRFLQCDVREMAAFATPILNRIIVFPAHSNEPKFTQVFDYVWELHREAGPRLSILFEGVNELRLTPEQRNKLMRLPDFIWKHLDQSKVESMEMDISNLRSTVGQLIDVLGIHFLSPAALERKRQKRHQTAIILLACLSCFALLACFLYDVAESVKQLRDDQAHLGQRFVDLSLKIAALEDQMNSIGRRTDEIRQLRLQGRLLPLTILPRKTVNEWNETASTRVEKDVWIDGKSRDVVTLPKSNSSTGAIGYLKANETKFHPQVILR
jgi:hypothetical protein